MRTILRVVRFSLQSTWRNLWLSFVSLTIFMLTLIIVNAVLFLHVVANSALHAVEDNVQLSVYFTPGTSPEMEASVRGYVLGLPHVKTVDTITSTEALATFKARHASDPSILAALEEVGGNPFGDALVISARSPEDFTFILEAVRRPEYASSIKETDYTDYKDVIARLSSFADRIRWSGLALAAFFALISVMIIFNAIRIAVYVHRDEIAIMKLVGAHDWFVRAPFLLEVVLLSLVATLAVAGIVLAAAAGLDAPFMRYFGEANVSVWQFFSTNALPIFGAEFLALAILGLTTTYVAMRRHLRV